MASTQLCLRAAISCGLLLLFIASGCSDGRPKRVPVAGKVLIDGKPVAAGSIQFVSQSGGGRPAAGQIQPDGSFALGTFDASDGCPPGTYAVIVSAIEIINDTKTRFHLPKKYGNPNSSGITKTIESATDAMIIELSWDGAPGPFDENRP